MAAAEVGEVTDIAIGAPIEAWPAAVYEQETTAHTSISSTSATAGSPALDFTFTSPSTGRVLLIIGGGFRCPTTNRLWLSPEVYEGASSAGTLIIDDTDLLTHGVGGAEDLDQYTHWTRRSLLSGLTPDTGHYARVMHFVSGGSDCDLRIRELAVVPVP